MFCVECGAEGVDMIGSVCRECYAKKHVWARLPDHVDLVLCAHCSSMQLHDDWTDIGSVAEGAEAVLRDALELPGDAALVALRVSIEERDPRNVQASVQVRLSSHGTEFDIPLQTVVRMKRGSCKECSKKMGSYYEAMLQVRTPGGGREGDAEAEVESFVRSRADAMRKGSRSVFISRVERVRGGLDFYFSTAQAARAIARELQETRCAEYKESSSLWGKRGGEEVSRMTYLVRLPGFGPGDVVEHGSRDYLVRSMSKGNVHAIDLLTGEARAIKVKEQSDFRLSSPASGVRRAVVLMETPSEVQVLDPDTMAPLDLRKPQGFVRGQEQARLVKTRLGAYVLSDSW
ncbi:MAG: NMD3-related protein [Candidatus Thermoplasmatota archaeon]